jgi:hypothetical protein
MAYLLVQNLMSLFSRFFSYSIVVQLCHISKMANNTRSHTDHLGSFLERTWPKRLSVDDLLPWKCPVLSSYSCGMETSENQKPMWCGGGGIRPEGDRGIVYTIRDLFCYKY